jgi:hypothetical protein
MEEDLEIFEGSSKLLKPAFASPAEYEKFRQEFYETMKPELERLRLARIRSEHESMFRRVN